MNKFNVLIITLAVLLSFSFSNVLAAPALTEEESGKIIGNVMSYGKDEHYVVFVEKNSNKLYLLKIKDDEQEIIEEIAVLTGKYIGNKLKRGDERTPEGVYYITNYMDENYMKNKFGTYAETYGTGAYPLNYPNAVDKINKKTGGGIWIHGLHPERHKPVTEGCVGLQNVDLDRIKPQLSITMPVVIVDNATFFTKKEYISKREDELKNLYSFIETWSYGSFDEFKKYVHPKYSSYSAPNADTYLKNKKYLMKAFPNKVITIDNISIFSQSDEQLVYDFNQFYCAENLVSYGNKRLYLIKDSDDYKVISEEMISKSSRDYLTPYIYDFLNNWKIAWESRDVNNYMNYYSSNFKNRSNWEKHKTKLFEATNTIELNLSKVNWDYVAGNTIKITFLQEYKSDTITDMGRKTLIIQGCPDNFKILSEEWSKL